MKPFNLEAAKRGEPICTRDGENVTFIGAAPDSLGVQQPVVAWIHDCREPDTFTTDGRYYNSEESGYDLFMAPTKQVHYLIVYREKSTEDLCATLCGDEMTCNHIADLLRNEGHTVLTHGKRIEWEE